MNRVRIEYDCGVKRVSGARSLQQTASRGDIEGQLLHMRVFQGFEILACLSLDIDLESELDFSPTCSFTAQTWSYISST